MAPQGEIEDQSNKRQDDARRFYRQMLAKLKRQRRFQNLTGAAQ